MKRFILAILILLIFVPFSEAVVVTTSSELMQAMWNKEPLIELNAESFTILSDFIINYDCVIRPHPDRSGQGGVKINGRWYNVQFRDAIITVGSEDPCNVLTFTSDVGVIILSLNKSTLITFNNCRFNDSWSFNGLSAFNGNYYLSVICNNCQASNNYNDGFSFHHYGGTSLSGLCATLNNCIARSNGINGSSTSSGDGVTAHSSDEIIIVNGGYFENNYKTGAAIVGGAQCYIYGGAVFRKNSQRNHVADIYAAEGSLLDISDIELGEVNGYAYGKSNIYVGNSYLRLSKSVFIDKDALGGDFVHLSDACGVLIENCIFQGGALDANSISLKGGLGCIIRNCTFFKNRYHIRAGQEPSAAIVNNIFSSATGCALFSSENFYNDPNSGYNCFYGNGIDICTPAGQLLDTDLVSDPLFADPENSDFHLKSTVGRYTSKIPKEDFNEDGIVNLYDLVIFSLCRGSYEKSLRSDFSGDMRIDTEDLLIFASSYLTEDANCSLDGDSFVDLKDFALFAADWGSFYSSLIADFNLDMRVDYIDLSLFSQIYLKDYEWIIDEISSPCIDAGSPETPWQNEPWPNGLRTNVGAYGNTAEASKSPQN